jgi:hypothetical protein
MTNTQPTAADQIRARPDYFGYDLGPALANLLDAIPNPLGDRNSLRGEDIHRIRAARAALEAVIRRGFPVQETRS